MISIHITFIPDRIPHMSDQPLTAQKGEIEFRKKLVLQQIDGVQVLSDEFDADSINKILFDRMGTTLKHMMGIKARNIAVSPYVEFGAERCQRSLVMENDVGASGAAVDISYDMLKSCSYYRKVFKKEKLPLRICCDINFLPFLSNSIPFMFCYQTVHHFPDPAMVTREVHRLLSPGGSFFFEEEPYKKVLHFGLYKRKIYAKETLQLSRFMKAVDFFLAKSVNNETDFGIIENDENPLSIWKKALAVFHHKDVTLTSIKGITADLFKPANRLRYLAAYLCGGGVAGLCRKGGTPVGQEKNIRDLLICPSCFLEKKEIPLMVGEKRLICGSCGKKYPIVDDILFLFPYQQFETLYPDIFKTV